MSKILSLFVLLSLPLFASAERAYITIGSNHTDNGNHCEFNPGILYETNSNYVGGFYRNSDCDWVAVAGKNVYTSRKFNMLQKETYLVVPVGIVVGYSSYPVLPWVLPTAVINLHSNVSLALSVIPLKEPIFGVGLVIDL